MPLVEGAHHTTQNFYSRTWICKDAFIRQLHLFTIWIQIIWFYKTLRKLERAIEMWMASNWNIFICLCSNIFSSNVVTLNSPSHSATLAWQCTPVSPSSDFLLIWFHLLILCFQQIKKSHCPTLVFFPWFRFPVWVVREEVVYM